MLFVFSSSPVSSSPRSNRPGRTPATRRADAGSRTRDNPTHLPLEYCRFSYGFMVTYFRKAPRCVLNTSPIQPQWRFRIISSIRKPQFTISQCSKLLSFSSSFPRIPLLGYTRKIPFVFSYFLRPWIANLDSMAPLWQSPPRSSHFGKNGTSGHLPNLNWNPKKETWMHFFERFFCKIQKNCSIRRWEARINLCRIIGLRPLGRPTQ